MSNQPRNSVKNPQIIRESRKILTKEEERKLIEEKNISKEEQQKLLLQSSIKKVKDAGFYMKKGMENNKLDESLLQASKFLMELRSSSLTPKNYYILCKKKN